MEKEINKKNKKTFSSFGYNSWLCEFKSEGIKII